MVSVATVFSHVLSPLVTPLRSLEVTGLITQINFDYSVGKTTWFWRVRDFKIEC